jgi:hypothetical protein
MLEKKEIESIRRAINNLKEGRRDDSTRSIPVHGAGDDFVVFSLVNTEDYWVVSLESLSGDRSNPDWKKTAGMIVAKVSSELGLSLIPPNLLMPEEKDMIKKLFDGMGTNMDGEIYVSESFDKKEYIDAGIHPKKRIASIFFN